MSVAVASRHALILLKPSQPMVAKRVQWSRNHRHATSMHAQWIARGSGLLGAHVLKHVERVHSQGHILSASIQQQAAQSVRSLPETRLAISRIARQIAQGLGRNGVHVRMVAGEVAKPDLTTSTRIQLMEVRHVQAPQKLRTAIRMGAQSIVREPMNLGRRVQRSVAKARKQEPSKLRRNPVLVVRLVQLRQNRCTVTIRLVQ